MGEGNGGERRNRLIASTMIRIAQDDAQDDSGFHRAIRSGLVRSDPRAF